MIPGLGVADWLQGRLAPRLSPVQYRITPSGSSTAGPGLVVALACLDLAGASGPCQDLDRTMRRTCPDLGHSLSGPCLAIVRCLYGACLALSGACAFP